MHYNLNSSIASTTNHVNLNSKIKTIKTKAFLCIFILFSFLLSIKQISAQPTITSFAPTSDTVGATVSITGTNFNTTPAYNVVFFGATRATVTAATVSNLTVIVPTGATFAPITVLNTATTLAAYSPQFFNPIFSPSKSVITTSDIVVKVDFATGTSPRSVAIGDLDGDGKSDLAIANAISRTVSIYRNTGSIDTVNFAAKVDFTTCWSPQSVAIGDIDGDGKPDLVIANAGSDTISIIRNTSNSGTINFATKVDFITGSLPYSLAIGDINGDGKPDLAITNYSSNTVSVLRNTGISGLISFATKIDFATGLNPYSVAIGDIDGDGKPDLAIANNGNTYTVSVFRNTGSNSVVSFASKIDFAMSSNSRSIAIGDLDGDGKPDLAIANNSVSILRNTSSSGTVSFATKVDFASGSNPYSLKIGDINGDGKPDLAITNQSNSTLSVLRNTGNSATVNFATKVDFASGSGPFSIAIGDIDGDGKPDLAIANQNSNSVSILRNSPQPPPPTINSFTPTSATISASILITGAGFNIVPANNIVFFGATKATVIAATDTNLTVTVPIGARFAPITVLNTVTTLAAYSTQFFNPTFNPNKDSITTADMAPKIDFTVGPDPRSVAIGDINGDGMPDLAIANYANNNVSILRNTGSSGTVNFATKVDFTTGTNPNSVAFSDIDGDGKLDLVIANYSSGNVSVLRNTAIGGTISFATKLDFIIGSNISSVAIDDIDRDGKPDITTINKNSSSISVLRNNSNSGTISFDAKVDFQTGSDPVSLAIGDINGDGKPDLAVANYISNTISVFRNTSSDGTVSFATKIDYNNYNYPLSVAIGDIDRDGKPDLAIINNGTLTKVSILRNTSSSGLISFATKVDFSISSNSPEIVTIGDINGDGKPDLIIGSAINFVSVLRNTGNVGTINFATKVDFTTGSSPQSVAVGDIDSDGKLDLVIANKYNQTVSVLRNNPQFPSSIFKTGILTPFSSCAGIASVQQTFTVSGIGLTGNIVIKPPTGFEVSTISGASFGDSISLPHTSGIVNNTLIYLRLTSSATGSPNGNVACTSIGATTQNVTISGLVKSTSTNITNVSICPNTLPYTWNGRTYNGNKNDTIFFTNTLGCDSMFILKLTIKQTSTSTNNISICSSELPYTWNGRTYNIPKTDTVYLTNSDGCDSVTIINLTIKATSTSTANLSICPGALPYTWNGLTFTSAGSQTKTGLINSVGCDSSATLNLTIKSTSSSTNNLSICPNALPYTWNGIIFTSAGSQTKIGLTNVAGCDSSATLNLIVKSISSSTNNLSICPSAFPYIWNGLTFTSAGSQTKTGLINSVGCDSSATLNLAVNPTPITSNIIPSANAKILDTASYSVYKTSGSVFNWSVAKGVIQSGSGTNKIQIKWLTTGIDTLKVIETSNLGCVGIQKTLLVNIAPSTGINELKASNGVIIYPNPFNETIHITLLNNLVLDKAILYDLLGKEIIITNKNEIDVKDLKSGVYLIQVLDNGGNIHTQKLIKN